MSQQGITHRKRKQRIRARIAKQGEKQGGPRYVGPPRGTLKFSDGETFYSPPPRRTPAQERSYWDF